MNKYRIDMNWSRTGPRFISNVIMDLINELNGSLKVSIMEESKSEGEVRKILDKSEGITIGELQIIDAWSLPRELRIEVRNKLEWSYRYLSRETARLIGERNNLPDREKSLAKSREIDNKNRELKNTIISQYGVIEKLVKNYKNQEKLDENKRKLLTYIRKVYCPALGETIENLFSTAPSGTERAKTFPFEERKEVFAKINNLKEEIWSLTKKNKQDQLNQQIQVLQQQVTQLQGQNNQIIEKLKSLIKGVDDKTSQEIGRAETRACLKEVRDGLEKTVVELKKEIGSNKEYQSLQVQLPKK